MRWRRSGGASDTVIAPDTQVQGKVVGEGQGRIRVHGRIIGGIETSGLAEIGATGEVAGDIRAGDVVVAGAIYGNVIAERHITLSSTARVFGDFIRTRELKVEHGALFQGKCEIEDPGAAADARAKLADLGARGKDGAPEPGKTAVEYRTPGGGGAIADFGEPRRQTAPQSFPLLPRQRDGELRNGRETSREHPL